jgi:PBSX family phage terminase large subunit
MSLVIPYQPLEVLKPFHASLARERYLFGGYGSGKSWALCAEAIAAGLEQPGSEIMVCRKTIPSLRDTTEAIFMSLLPQQFVDACVISRAGGHLNTVLFPNGSLYYFRGMDDWTKHKSHNLAFMFWDEADEMDLESFEGMMSRIRQVRPTNVPAGTPPITRRGIVCASNPAGHNWLWQRAVNPETKHKHAAHFVSTSLDNPHLPFDTLESWLNMPDPWVRRFVMCSFEEFAGQVYESWHWDTHVIKPFRNARNEYAYDPSNWFVMGFDPGTSSGNAALWCYYDRPNHRLVGVAEYLESGLAATVHAASWKKIEREHRMRRVTRIADGAAITVRDRGTNMGLDDQYRRLGFPFQVGPRRIEDRLYPLGQLIHSRRFVITEDCPETYKQIVNYRYEDLTPTMRLKGGEPKPLKKDVDLVDAAQYCSSRFIAAPKFRQYASEKEQFTAEVNAAIKRQLTQKRFATSEHDLGSVPV